MLTIGAKDPLGVAVTEAIHRGDLDALNHLLADNPGLVTATIGGRPLLHVATDWPGHFPNVASVIRTVIAAGADPDATPKPGDETALHWAASSDDLKAIDALLDCGANMEVRGASIAGGTALEDAVGYGQWQAARRLVERGAKVEKLWHAAALGIMPLVEAHFAGPSAPTPGAVSDAFWQACHGGQLRAAEFLLARGADLNWVPDWAKETPLDMAESSGANDLLEWLRAHGARSSKGPS
jgi:ankyrin repeat protein